MIYSNLQISELFSIAETGYLKDVINEVKKYDQAEELHFFIYFKRATDPKINFRELSISENFVLIISGDESEYIPEELPKNCICIFKNYLPVSLPQKRIFHLPVGPNQHVPEFPIVQAGQRKFNIFFSGNLHAGRSELYSYLTYTSSLPFWITHRMRFLLGENFDDKFKASYIRFTRKFLDGLSFEEYAQMLYNSKIVLCPGGNPGMETLRHYEAMRAGCVIITREFSQAEIFRKAPLVKISSWKELGNIVKSLMGSPDKLAQIANDTEKFYNTNLSPTAVSKYMLACIRKSKNV